MSESAFTVSDLLDYEERFERENCLPFGMPSELSLVHLEDCAAFDRGRAVFDFADRAEREADDLRYRGDRDPQTEARTEREGSDAPASNTGPAKYHLADFPRGWGGFDGGVEASFYGEWDAQAFAELVLVLDRAKKAADEGKEADSYVEFGAFIWKVRAVGAGAGSSSGVRFAFKWVLESRGVKLYVHSNPTPGIPAFRVRFGAECLMQTDLFEAVEALKKCFDFHGFKIKTEVVSRVDAQVLLPVTVADFAFAMQGDRIVTRCRGTYTLHANLQTGDLETISIRSKSCELCIYDKKAELAKSDYIYFDIFCRSVLGDEDANIPDRLTRVEFRFKRDYLAHYGVDTFDDLRGKIAALLDLVSSDWFRILERKKVRGSEREIKNAPIWERVRQAFRYYFSSKTFDRATVTDLKSYKRLSGTPQIERIAKQAVGCLATVASFCMDQIKSGFEVVDFCSALLASYERFFYTKVKEKQIDQEIRRNFRRSYEYDCVSSIQDDLGNCDWHGPLYEFA